MMTINLSMIYWSSLSKMLVKVECTYVVHMNDCMHVYINTCVCIMFKKNSYLVTLERRVRQMVLAERGDEVWLLYRVNPSPVPSAIHEPFTMATALGHNMLHRTMRRPTRLRSGSGRSCWCDTTHNRSKHSPGTRKTQRNLLGAGRAPAGGSDESTTTAPAHTYKTNPPRRPPAPSPPLTYI